MCYCNALLSMVLKCSINTTVSLSAVLNPLQPLFLPPQRADILILARFINQSVLFCLFSRFSPGAGTAASPEESAGFLSFHELSELMQALPGFLMLLTGEGKLLYLSDSVSEHLGHSMVSTHAFEKTIGEGDF